MRSQPRILAGTALGLLMAATPLGAISPVTAKAAGTGNGLSVLLAQAADCQEGESAEDCAARAQPPAQEEPRQEQPAAPQQTAPEQLEPEQPEAAPAEQAEPQQVPETAPEPSPQQVEPEQAEPEQVEPAPAPEQQPDVGQVEPTPEAAPTPEPKEAPAEGAAPAPEAAPTPAPKEAPAEEAAPAPEAPPTPTPKEAPAEEAAPTPEPAPVPKETTPKQPAEQQESQTPEQEPAEAAPVGEGQQPAQVEPSGEAAPMLDSQKDAQRPARRDGERKNERDAEPAGTGEPVETPVDQGPPPTDDRAAQQAIQPEQIQPVTQEKGTRREHAPNEDIRRRPRPEGADILKELGDRVIIRFGDSTFVESDERPRMRRGARDFYYEDLPRGQTRETIVRENGSQVVTIRNRNGDVIRRSRITPDGREYVLSYVDQRHYEDIRDWRDPGDDLPPLRLDIPRDRYILESESVHDPRDYYDFLEQPPVERVQRLYSVDEVKRSARVRDIARRVDLDTLNFEFGSAAISESEVAKLQGVADAIERLLERNPAETFLIEGHTDAVGSDTANLALSDRRAEAVADALTNVFDIPPENLTTQGYGERYLKVDTQSPERENRRVAIRRITPLVAPAVSAK